MKNNKTKELIEELNKENMLWMFIGSLISSDTVYTRTNIEKSLEIINDMKYSLINERVDIDDKTKNKLEDKLMECEEILEKELEKIK